MQTAGDVMNFAPLQPQQITGRRKPRKRRAHAPLLGLLRRLGLARPPDLDDLSKRILLPSLPVSDEEHARDHWFGIGQRCARQEDWDVLAERILEADHNRLQTPGGEMVSSLIAQGARADLVAAAEHAIADGRAPDKTGLAALHAVLTEHAGSYPVALMVARAHVDIGLAWRANGAAAGEMRFLEHFAIAEALLDPLDAPALDAPSLASAQCALLAARPAPRRRVAEDYARLINLDPATPAHLRALGEALLPARFGSYQEIEIEARRAAARTGAAWGEGGYAWVWFDALALDPAGLGTVDAAYFADGLRAIAQRKPDQHVINQLAAFCGLTMAPRGSGTRMSAAQDRARATIHGCLDWLIADHLHELHPLLWSQAILEPGRITALPPRRTLLQTGRQTALRTIAACFAEEMADGQTLAFSSAGMYRLPVLGPHGA
ncbi:MAG: hypothetical protein CVT70_13350 [Alphaproteobacteria bacterium HGW-Alphaproteobacteria-1]|nr:MAG: hypothetical protein CVT70_13350 [Alphaproteobacteria bacterium HGW-Alphaproteobacteria-1]